MVQGLIQKLKKASIERNLIDGFAVCRFVCLKRGLSQGFVCLDGWGLSVNTPHGRLAMMLIHLHSFLGFSMLAYCTTRNVFAAFKFLIYLAYLKGMTSEKYLFWRALAQLASKY